MIPRSELKSKIAHLTIPIDPFLLGPVYLGVGGLCHARTTKLVSPVQEKSAKFS